MRGSASLKKLLALFFVSALVLAACGDDGEDATDTGGTDTTEAGDDGGDKESIKLAYVGPLTGDAANLGILIRDGAKTAIEEYNKSEDAEYKIELVEFDTAGDPAQATTVKDEYINDEEIVGIIGPAFSGETKAVLPALQEAGLPMVSASATNKDLPSLVTDDVSVFHRVLADDTFQGKGIGEYIVNELKAKSIVLIDDNSEYGKGLANDTEAAIKGAGGTVAKRLTVDPKSQDFSAAVNDAKAEDPEVVFYSGYYQEAGRMRKQLADGGVDATFLSGDGSLDVGFIQSAGSAAEGALVGCPCNLATADSPGKLGEFYKSYKETIGKEPGIYGPEAYDAAGIFIEAIKAGNTDRKSILEYLETEFDSFDGASKTVEFEKNGNVTVTDVFVFEVKGGKFVARES